MKKWVVFVVLGAILAGCGSGGAKEASISESSTEKSTETTSSTKQSTAKTKASSVKKKVTFKAADFQIEESAYQIKIPDTWEVTSEEDFDFYASDENNPEVIMIYGMKKTDFEGIDAFKNAMIGQIVSDEDVQIKEESRKEVPYQTAHYSGYLYTITTVSDGANVGIQYYFLETEVDYVVVNIAGLPSFYDRNAETITEMLNSFVSVEQMNTQNL